MNRLLTRLSGQVAAIDTSLLAHAIGASQEFNWIDAIYAGRGRFEALPSNVSTLHIQGPLFADEYAGFIEIMNGLDASVDTLVLHISSPGGVVSGLWDFCDAIYAQRSVRNVIAVCEHMAASAGYAIASQANGIVCDQDCTVGSIGVRAIHFDYSEAFKADGLNVTELHFGSQKIDGTPFAPLSKGARGRMQAEIDQSGEKFLEIVARGRGDSLSLDAARATEAGVFHGQSAVDAGLADEVSTVAEFIAAFSAV